MALIHRFILISQKDYYPGYRKNIKYLADNQIKTEQKYEDLVIIDDDFILYIADSLKWIPSYNPATNKEGKNINYHGVTLFNYRSAEIMLSIFESWLNLFNNAPEEIVLKGDFYLYEGTTDGAYEKLEYNKSDLIGSLKNLYIFHQN